MLLCLSTFFSYHEHLCKDFFINRDDTVDVGYKEQVDTIISLVVHNNHWWNLMLHDNTN